MNYDYSLRLESGSLYVDKRLHGSGKLELPYARVEGGIAIIMKNEWYLCTPKNDEVGSGGGIISFYAEPTREGTDPVVLNTSSISEKQAEELREILGRSLMVLIHGSMMLLWIGLPIILTAISSSLATRNFTFLLMSTTSFTLISSLRRFLLMVCGMQRILL